VDSSTSTMMNNNSFSGARAMMPPPPPRRHNHNHNHGASSSSSVAFDQSTVVPDVARSSGPPRPSLSFNSTPPPAMFSMGRLKSTSASASASTRRSQPPPRHLQQLSSPRSRDGDRDAIRSAHGHNSARGGAPATAPRSASSVTSTANVRTSQITHRSTNHGALRRLQRNIGVRDLQAAIKYGTRTPAGRGGGGGKGRGSGWGRRKNNNPRSKYEYNGITYIVDDVTKEEITTYSNLIDLRYKCVTVDQKHRHEKVRKRLQTPEGKQQWKSHTVLLVDKSGSMRSSDVNGSKTRLQAVFLAIAQDFIEQRIDSGEAKDEHDVVTLVLVGDEPLVVLDCVPTDWVLFNTMVDLYYGKYTLRRAQQLGANSSATSDDECTTFSPAVVTSSSVFSSASLSQSKDGKQMKGGRKRGREKKMCGIQPGGHGNFIPAIQLAHDMLTSNDHSSCTLTLALLSDGRPSDMGGSQVKAHAEILKYTEHLASLLGTRFNLFTIGIGSADHQFSLLQEMVKLCGDYGSKGAFQLPSLSASALGAAFSSLASSVTLSQMELTGSAMAGGRLQKRVRTVHRERASMVPLLTEAVDETHFNIVMGSEVSRLE
jgi:hypothetical protein